MSGAVPVSEAIRATILRVQQPLLVGAAVTILLWHPFSSPAPTLGVMASCALGAAAGAVTFCFLARGRRPSPRAERRTARTVARCLPMLVAAAVAEETLWRYAAIGGLRLTTGTATAAAAATGAFALAHLPSGVRAVPIHVVTGLVFTAAYVGTGHLAAAVAAHAAYNLLVVALPARAPEAPAAQPV